MSLDRLTADFERPGDQLLAAAMRPQGHDSMVFPHQLRKRRPADAGTTLLLHTRPALTDARARTHAAGRVALKLTTPWRDGTTHLVISLLGLMQRRAALVPKPRLHLIRSHGVPASKAKMRAQVVPQELEPPAQ